MGARAETSVPSSAGEGEGKKGLRRRRESGICARTSSRRAAASFLYKDNNMVLLLLLLCTYNYLVFAYCGNTYYVDRDIVYGNNTDID